jgi:hypothetical protein
MGTCGPASRLLLPIAARLTTTERERIINAIANG